VLFDKNMEWCFTIETQKRALHWKYGNVLITMALWKRALHWKYGNVLITVALWKRALHWKYGNVLYNGNMETF